ncbi:hypothetical protein B0H10DRAFT_2202054 [Mycena sp. CBHHK59/15]|nr:hypothetical protein B0H10DRAFT_2202054 [Mycena sp. CBHHK59/15]
MCRCRLYSTQPRVESTPTHFAGSPTTSAAPATLDDSREYISKTFYRAKRGGKARKQAKKHVFAYFSAAASRNQPYEDLRWLFRPSLLTAVVDSGPHRPKTHFFGYLMLQHRGIRLRSEGVQMVSQDCISRSRIVLQTEFPSELLASHDEGFLVPKASCINPRPRQKVQPNLACNPTKDTVPSVMNVHSAKAPRDVKNDAGVRILLNRIEYNPGRSILRKAGVEHYSLSIFDRG